MSSDRASRMYRRLPEDAAAFARELEEAAEGITTAVRRLATFQAIELPVAEP